MLAMQVISWSEKRSAAIVRHFIGVLSFVEAILPQALVYRIADILFVPLQS